jgi:capsular exopolysaccharide synthesis family protein
MPTLTPTSFTEGRDLRSLATIVWRRRWIVAIPAVAGLLTGFVVGLPKILKPVYRAQSALLVEYPQPVSRNLQEVLPTTGLSDQKSRLQSLMQSNEFLLKVADASGLRGDPGLQKWVARSRRQYRDMTDQQLQDLQLTKWLRTRMLVMPGRSDNTILIRYDDYYPAQAQLVVQNLTNAIIKANTSAQLDRVRALYDFSVEQLAVYKQRLSDAEKKLEDFQRGVSVDRGRASLVGPANESEARRQREQANDELSRVTRERDALRASLQSRSPGAAAEVRSGAGPAWAAAVQEVCDLEKQYAQETIAPTPGEGSETLALMIARKLQGMEDLARQAVAQPGRNIPEPLRGLAVDLLLAEARAAGIESRAASYDRQLGDYQSQLAGTPREETTLKRLQQDVETNRTLYNAFVQQIAATQISQAFEANQAGIRLTVLEPPSRPLAPIKPNRVAVAVLGLVVGILLGIGGLVVVERHDQTFRDAREAERSLGLRVLGTLPQIDGGRRGKGDRIAWTPKQFEAFLKDSPAYQEMRRVALQLRNDEESPVRSLLVTSARGGEGKTTACIMLGAAVAAEEPKVPVLLVDLDFRRASLGRALGVEKDDGGLVKILESRRFDEGWPRKTGVPNLHVLPLGCPPMPRNDLLTFENLSWLLPELTRRYGFVIIDSPPNLPVPDPLIIGQLVDAVILVLKAGGTPRHMVERGVELQKQFTGNLRGLLMNNMDETMPYYYDYRHYGYSKRKQTERG